MGAHMGNRQTAPVISRRAPWLPPQSGGLLGLGGGNGMLYRIVAADTDLVYGIVCEEWGWLIAFCVAACFVGLGLYAVRLAKGCRLPYFAISVCAAAAIMVFQTALNIFGSSDILPSPVLR